jgi:hypothetical protein
MTTNGQTTRLHKLFEATNDQDWQRAHSYLADDVVHHHATQGLGSTEVQSNGADQIIDAHRRLVGEMGVRYEVVAVAEAEDLLTGIIMLHFPNGKRALGSLTYRFNEAGLVCDVYSYSERPS